MDISIKVTYKSEGLQKLRKAAGLSQSQLADLAGIKVQVLQQYERGARDINGAKLPTLLKICNALECRLADIITDEETLELLKFQSTPPARGATARPARWTPTSAKGTAQSSPRGDCVRASSAEVNEHRPHSSQEHPAAPGRRKESPT